MAYRAPQYSHLHAARDAGASAITVSNTAHADFPKENMIDDRPNGTLFKWSGSFTNPTISIDLGAGFPTGLNRLIIPANHNIQELSVIEDQTDTFASPTTLHSADTAPVPGVLYDSGPFNTNVSTSQFIRVTIIGTAQYFIPELFLTKILTFTPGPDLRNSTDGRVANVTRLEQASGISPTVQNGPNQRVIEYLYNSPLSGADLTAMESFINSVGMARPFYVDPASFSTPPKTDEPALCMKFVQMPELRYTVEVPMSGTRVKAVRISLIESVD